MRVALWGIPTAVCAFLIHAWRLQRLDRMLERDIALEAASSGAQAAPAATGAQA